MAQNFKELRKDVNDLLFLEFLSGSGLSIERTGKLPHKINLRVNSHITDQSSGLFFEPKYLFKPQNTLLQAKLSTAEINGRLIAKDVAKKGTKVEVGVDWGQDLLGLKLSPSFKTDNLSLESTLSCTLQGPQPALTLSNEAVFHFKRNYFLGLNVTSVLDPNNLPRAAHRADATLHVDMRGLGLADRVSLAGRIGMSSRERGLSWGLSYWSYKFARQFKWAVECSGDSRGGALAVAGERKLHEGSLLKSKWSAHTNGEVRQSVAWKYYITKHTAITAGLDINLQDITPGVVLLNLILINIIV
eukprot:TRINITY_DN7185_c0_g1_i1.p1 TRINITY_DN7185_c0_g1~~TRINITY_DN7185_c0_g1_i1.p1  ORF type:complete len:302 (-),score=42.82 TRINITY_DN7185_c0_g1_i1:21-926(-)